MSSDPWQIVRDFERTIAEFAGSRFAVAVDTGTAALFLCCHYLRVREVTLPARTYLSVPCSVIHAGGRVRFDDREWSGSYRLEPYPIVDSACRFRRGMHAFGDYTCLSFQYRKHLKIGRGGMILHDHPEADAWLRQARFSGRHEVPLAVDRPTMVGWHLFLEPERAAKGLQLFSLRESDHPLDLQFDYPDLRTFQLYEGVRHD